MPDPPEAELCQRSGAVGQAGRGGCRTGGSALSSRGSGWSAEGPGWLRWLWDPPALGWVRFPQLQAGWGK